MSLQYRSAIGTGNCLNFDRLATAGTFGHNHFNGINRYFILDP
jgi:hypothetical protein